MKRGTIIAAGQGAPFDVSKVRFGTTGVGRPAVIAMVAVWLRKLEFEFEQALLFEREFLQFAGDLANGGRGELFVGRSAS